MAEGQAKARIWEIEYYIPYFDVTSTQVFHRVKKSILPTTESFFEHETADMYGPLWISTTFIFLLVFSGHLVNYINADETWNFDVAKVGTAAVMIYGFLILIPLGLYFVLSNQGSPITALELVSLYGYSYSAFLIASAVSIIPYGLVRFISMGAAGVWSGLLYFKNYWGEIEGTVPAKKFLLGFFAVFGHVVITLGSIFYFYD